ncbi:MAG: FmdB family zinc ribbon protein [bacterium]
MPTYEYLCDECSYRFEEFQSITAEPLKSCPRCDGTIKRLISAGNGLIFKGSGFYETDYKRSGATAESKPEKSDKKSKDKTTKEKE